MDDVIQWAEGFRLDRQRDQTAVKEVWCEAAGMVPQMVRVSDQYGIPVYSSSGFDSVTAKYRAAERAAATGSLIVLHVGDLDPSGVHFFSSASEDVAAFAADLGGTVEFVRVAVTPDQVAAHNLPTAPPKPTDRRAFSGETCQAEALDPATLATILDDAIRAHMDMALYQSVMEEERSDRDELLHDLRGWQA